MIMKFPCFSLLWTSLCTASLLVNLLALKNFFSAVLMLECHLFMHYPVWFVFNYFHWFYLSEIQKFHHLNFHDLFSKSWNMSFVDIFNNSKRIYKSPKTHLPRSCLRVTDIPTILVYECTHEFDNLQNCLNFILPA